MSIFKLLHPESNSCLSDSLAVFDVPPTQLDVLETHYTAFKPITTLGKDGTPLEFNIHSSSELFTNLSQTYLKLQLQILNDDESEIATDVTVYPIPNLLGGLFSSLELTVNDTVITSSSANYGYRSFLQNALVYSSSAKKSHLANYGFYSSSGKKGFKKRFKDCVDKKFELYGNIVTDLASQSKYILNGVDLKFKFLRNSASFTLICDDIASQKSPYIKIIDATLYIPRIKLQTDSFLSIQARLLKNTAKYPISHVQTKVFTLMSGISSKTLTSISNASLPTRLIIGLVDHSSYNGSYKSNPYKFSHCDITSVSVQIDGNILGQAYKTSFSDDNSKFSMVSRAYQSLFEVSGTLNALGNSITMEEYVSDLPLFSFDLTADVSSADCNYISPIRTGDLGINFTFGKPLPSTTNVIVYLEYLNLIQIDKHRTIITNF